MGAQDVIERVLEKNLLVDSNLKWCFVDDKKIPFNGKDLARPNHPEDFVDISELNMDLLETYKGLGISIQASKICAIDVDHCFSSPFDLTSGDERAVDIINMFRELTYIEFSFSGTGLRVLFLANQIKNYSEQYYIKNSKRQCEYYYPEGSNRYVTITGYNISEKAPNFVQDEVLLSFLRKYMEKPKIERTERNFPIVENIDGMLLHYIRTNKEFQDDWFDPAPGFGSNESERDYFMIKFIYENITQNKRQIKEIFERSPFFKSKDRAHVRKWERSDNAYYEYLYKVISGGTE